MTAFKRMKVLHGLLPGHILNMNLLLPHLVMTVKLRFGKEINKETGKILYSKSNSETLLIVLHGLHGNTV